MGGYGLAQLDLGLALRFSVGGDACQALDEYKPSAIPESEVLMPMVIKSSPGTSELILSVLMDGIRAHFQVESFGYIMDNQHLTVGNEI